MRQSIYMSVKGSCFTVHVFFFQQKKVSFIIHSSSPYFQGLILFEMPPISCYDLRMSKMVLFFIFLSFSCPKTYETTLKSSLYVV